MANLPVPYFQPRTIVVEMSEPGHYSVLSNGQFAHKLDFGEALTCLIELMHSKLSANGRYMNSIDEAYNALYELRYKASNLNSANQSNEDIITV